MTALLSRLLFPAAAFLLVCRSLSAASIFVPSSVSASTQSDFCVYWLLTNESDAETDIQVPREMKALLHSGSAHSEPVLLRFQGAEQSVKLARGSFVRLEYRFNVPSVANGPVVLDVPGSGAGPVMFSVQSIEQAQTASQVPSAEKSAEIRREAALRRSTRLLPGLSSYEPVYFGMGLHGGASAKFQISLKYNPFDQWPFYLGYTQTSIWDLQSTSKPFRDSSYRPAFFLHRSRLWTSQDGSLSFGGQGGFEHESNGKSGVDSRSINIAFVRPRLEWRLSEQARLIISPKVYAYIEKSENPDIGEYRGFMDLYLGVVYRGFQVSTTLRKGTRDSYGSIQADAVFPLRSSDAFLSRVGIRGMNGYLFFQYFNGWGESILDYRRKLPSQFRAGLMVVP
jgi:outer membrane phospholipase A